MILAFKFRLQKILNLKEKAEENKKNEISVVLKEISEKEEEIKKLNIDRDKEILTRKKLNSEGSTINKIIDINNFIEYIEKEIDVANEELQVLNNKLKIKQNEYLEAQKEKKSFEKLKEKDLKKYKEEEAKEEAKVIDQIVTFSSSKRNKGAT